MQPSRTSVPGPGLSRRFVAGWALLAGAVMFALGVFRNDFPCEYHPDEPSKVAQLIDGTRNYHHPPLMLTLADAAARVGGVARQPEALARVGRTLSAAYLAGAVALLTVLAGIYGGTRGAVVTAAGALCIDAQAVLAAHFFKEDALFMFALALTFVAGAIHWRRRGKLDALALGAAAGLALSSKYLGALAVVYALVLAVLAGKTEGRAESARHRPQGDNAEGQKRKANGGVAGGRLVSPLNFGLLPSAFCLSGLLLALALCSGPALWGHFEEIRAGWRLGVSTVQEGNGGVGAAVPHLQFVGMLFVLTPLPVLFGAAVFWADLRKYPFRAHADRWLAGLSPLWLTAVFSFSASTAVRYFLPVSLLLGCLAGVALPGAVRWAAARIGARAAFFTRPAGAASAALGLVLMFSLPGAVSLLAGFAGDDRAELTRWIADHLPPGSIIAQDDLARLPVAGASDKIPPAHFAFIGAPSVADLGNLEQMREGAEYVVVCWYDSRRYVDPRKHPGPDARDFLRRREFYQNLSAHARSLWKSDLRQPYPLRPGLELFALDPPGK